MEDSAKPSSMALRILTALGGGKVGGAEAFFVSLNLALKRAGQEVHSVIRSNPVHDGALSAGGIPVDHAGFGTGFDFWTGWKLARVAKTFVPDIALTFASRASAHMPVGPYKIVGRLGGYYKLRHFQKCDILVCNTPDLVRYVVEQGWPQDRAFHIPNFPYLEENIAAASRASLDTPESAPVALALGRLHPNKAHDVLLRAAAMVPDLYVWIAGEGPERAKLEALACELGIERRVKFLGWRTDRAALFKAATVCAYPSREEPFGNVVVEAWSFGLPLVTTASHGPAWLTRNGEDAIVTPVDDAEAFAAGLRQVLQSPGLAATLVSHGARRVREEFSEDAIVGQYLELFRRITR